MNNLISFTKLSAKLGGSILITLLVVLLLVGCGQTENSGLPVANPASPSESKLYSALKSTGDKTWGWLYPTIPTNNLSSIACPTANICYLAGAEGTILFTNNGGQSWLSQNSNVTEKIRRLKCTSVINCYGLTESYKFLATDNGGIEWKVSALNSNASQLACLRPQTCYVATVKGQVSLTQDGGKTWQVQTQNLASTTKYSFVALSCPNPTTCWIAGSGPNFDMSKELSPIFVTYDSGKTWKPQPTPTTNPIADIFCLDTSNCWAVGWRSLILRTTDGGDNWKVQKPQLVSKNIMPHLAKVTCLSPTQCVAVGESSLFSTLDNRDWQQQKPAKKPLTEFQDVTCTSPTNCFIVGEVTPLLVSRDKSNTWEEGFAPSTSVTNLAEISCPTSKACYASSRDGKILTTKDGGLSWQLNQAIAGTGTFKRKIACPAISNCYIMGQANSLFVTNDGGVTWNTLSYANAMEQDEEILDIICPTSLVCYLNGSNGLILNSSDGGKTWLKQPTGTNLDILKISCPNPLVCFAVGATENKGFTTTGTLPAEGVILQTTNGGQNWKISSKSAELIFNSLSCPTPITCFAVQKLFGDTLSAPLAIRQTVNAGQSWEKVGQITAAGIINCPSSTSCYVASEDGLITTTSDGGKTWTIQKPGAGPSLSSISCPESKLCYLISSNTANNNSSILVRVGN